MTKLVHLYYLGRCWVGEVMDAGWMDGGGDLDLWSITWKIIKVESQIPPPASALPCLAPRQVQVQVVPVG